MIRLRPYKPSDAHYLLKWQGDEYAFAQWCAYKFSYPLTEEQLISYYHQQESDEHAWIMSALDDDGTPVGHLLMRMADYQNESIHFGFIIIDPLLKGKGIGKEMVSLASSYAFDILKVNKITLSVFDNNPSAHNCYKAAGFEDVTYHESAFAFEKDYWGIYDMIQFHQ